MLLFTFAYNGDREDIIEEIKNMKEYFKYKNIDIGFSESVEESMHFIKIFSNHDKLKTNFLKLFQLYIGNILYRQIVKEFYKKELHDFLHNTYFFFKNNEINEIKQISLKALKCEDSIENENSIYYINRKSNVVQRIIDFIKENKEINVNGFVTFRMNEFRKDLQQIVDKVVEKYMIDKEYNEFIKLLKYFVEFEESKINEVNIIINKEGLYLIQDENGNDISNILFDGMLQKNFTEKLNLDDMLISGLIATCPKNIIIHCANNCNNVELLDTIKKVFEDRITFCNNCSKCNKINNKIKI